MTASVLRHTPYPHLVGSDPSCHGCIDNPTATLVVAEEAPLGVQLWPTATPDSARNFTLAAVEVLTRKARQEDGSWCEYPATVVWTYQSGNERRFRLGEEVACQLPTDGKAPRP
jgi:hypothetical protein